MTIISNVQDHCPTEFQVEEEKSEGEKVLYFYGSADFNQSW